MAELRSRLFLSYSRADSEWRDAFKRQLSAMFVSDELWVDTDDIPWGSNWEPQITRAISQSRCALLLLTPEYLDTSSYARRELMLLLAAAPQIKLLPVLVEDCPWQLVPGLQQTQLVRWPGGVRLVAGPSGEEREQLAPLAQAAERDHAIIDICQRARKEMGVIGQTLPGQIDALREAAQAAVGDSVELGPAVHSGTFSVVYRARLHGEQVAVKAVPDAPRQNRLRQFVAEALPKVQRLTDPAFIRLRAANLEGEPHCLVMDFIDWPTLEQRLPQLPGQRLDARSTITVLAQVARAQVDAHAQGLLVGPLTLGSVHVHADWTVRLSPLRIESMMARAANLATGQLLNWEALTYLAPEISAGQAGAVDRAALDALDQYHLGLLGLELLLGRPPCEVQRFDDLAVKAQFFDNPRAFFDDGSGDKFSWVDRQPALAWLLIRLLARLPSQRLPGSQTVAQDLQALAAGALPPSLRAQIEVDLDTVMASDFTLGFYQRLVAARPQLAAQFGKPERQAQMLAAALPDLLAFDPQFPRSSRFHRLVQTHAGYGLDSDDVEAFRSNFLAQIDRAFGSRAGHVEAWRAALDRGLKAMAEQLPPGVLERTLGLGRR